MSPVSVQLYDVIAQFYPDGNAAPSVSTLYFILSFFAPLAWLCQTNPTFYFVNLLRSHFPDCARNNDLLCLMLRCVGLARYDIGLLDFDTQVPVNKEVASLLPSHLDPIGYHDKILLRSEILFLCGLAHGDPSTFAPDQDRCLRVLVQDKRLVQILRAIFALATHHKVEIKASIEIIEELLGMQKSFNSSALIALAFCLMGDSEGFSGIAARLSQPVPVFPIFNMKNVIDHDILDQRDVANCFSEVCAVLGWQDPAILYNIGRLCLFDVRRLCPVVFRSGSNAKLGLSQ